MQVNKSLRVSVVIPVYNEEKYLDKCLQSIIKQQVKADEIIVINNNSTDNTVAIAKKYPVRIINEKTQGLTPARNRGFNEAKYEIIARTDADTILPANWIKKIKKHFEKDDDVVAVSGPTNFYDLPSQVTKKTVANVHKTYLRLMKKILKHDCLFGPNIAIRKGAWQRIKNEVCMDDTKVHEDIDLAIHISPLGKITFDRTLEVSSSFRRFKNLDSFDSYFEYPYRVVTSIRHHKPFAVKQRSKQFVKKVMERAFSFEQIPSEFK